MTTRSNLNFDTLHPGKTPFGVGSFASRRSTVMGTKGMASSSNPLASAAGIKILEQGGNAADAAIAVAAALNVTEPCSTGIGGDAFCLFWNEKEKTVKGLNGSGRSPGKLTLESLKSQGLKQIPLTSVHSVTVPGTAASWVDTHERFGSGKLTLSQILAPAISLAEEGFPVHELTGQAWTASEEKLKSASKNGGEMLLPNGKAPKAGDIMRLPNLAKTFRTLAEGGKEAFYRGEIAESIVEVCKSLGGCMELEDLEHHLQVGSEAVEPISYEYGATKEGEGDGVTLYECPPSGQGLVALIALGILDSLQRNAVIPDLTKMDHNSPEYLHALIEALRFGFADAHQYIADSQHGGSDHVKGLLSRSYLDERAKLFNPKEQVEIQHGSPPVSSDTVYMTCSDSEGNACSFIQSNYAGFGSCIIPKGCGFTLANRCCTFRFEENYPNSVGPRKRPYNTIIPAMATKRGKDGKEELFLSYGVMGGFMQPQGHVQVLLNLLRGFTPQAAIDAPRFCIGAGTPDQGAMDSTVYMENGIDENTIEELNNKGHSAKLAKTWKERVVFGRGQIIARIQTDSHYSNDKGWAWAAGSDPRADGSAIAQV